MDGNGLLLIPGQQRPRVTIVCERRARFRAQRTIRLANERKGELASRRELTYRSTQLEDCIDRLMLISILDELTKICESLYKRQYFRSSTLAECLTNIQRIEMNVTNLQAAATHGVSCGVLSENESHEIHTDHTKWIELSREMVQRELPAIWHMLTKELMQMQKDFDNSENANADLTRLLEQVDVLKELHAFDRNLFELRVMAESLTREDLLARRFQIIHELCSLGNASHIQNTMVESGVVSSMVTLIKLLGDSDLNTMREVCSILRLLSDGDHQQTRYLVECGVIPIMLAVTLIDVNRWILDADLNQASEPYRVAILSGHWLQIKSDAIWILSNIVLTDGEYCQYVMTELPMNLDRRQIRSINRSTVLSTPGACAGSCGVTTDNGLISYLCMCMEMSFVTLTGVSGLIKPSIDVLSSQNLVGNVREIDSEIRNPSTTQESIRYALMGRVALLIAKLLTCSRFDATVTSGLHYRISSIAMRYVYTLATKNGRFVEFLVVINDILDNLDKRIGDEWLFERSRITRNLSSMGAPNLISRDDDSGMQQTARLFDALHVSSRNITSLYTDGFKIIVK